MGTIAETMVLGGVYLFLKYYQKEKDVITVSPFFLSFDLFPVSPTGII